MKKLKWILLIITILMMALFLFATCRKTKATEMEDIYTVFTNTTQTITSYDTNSGFAGVYLYNPQSQNNINNIPFKLNYGLGNLQLVHIFYNNEHILAVDIIGDTTYFIQLNNSFGYYVIIGEDDNTNLNMDIVLLSNNISNGSVSVAYSHNYYNFDNYTWGEDINRAYNSQNGVIIDYFYNKYYDCVFNAFWYDCSDYSLTFTEQVADICPKLLENVNTANYNIIYNLAYQAGYNEGYDTGESAGYTAGYNAGYTAGESAGYTAGYTAGEGDGYRSGYDTGYDAGYDAGLLAGYNNGLADNVAGQTEAYNAGYEAGKDYGLIYGYLDGYDEGYDEGYNVGYNEGFNGATPVSRTVTLIGSIFGSIGTVLSIQLFPGFSLGLLILVPLFFAVLGLILWIWRRN